MASPLPSISRAEASILIKQVQGTSLFNRQLSSVCQVNGLKSTGVKADLQRRIIDLIQETIAANDVSRFHQIRHSIINAQAQRSSPSKGASSRTNPIQSQSSSLPGSSYLSHSMPSYNHTNGLSRDYHSSPSNGSRIGMSYASSSPSLTFTQSPFYHVEAGLTDVRTCDVMTQHRNSVNIPLKLNDNSALQKCLTDKSYRVMIFCASEITGVQHVAFPHQSELRVNGGDIKANLRGLKNKPGSTRPVDITSALRLRPNYINNIEFTYALTTKASAKAPSKFYLIVNLCRVTSVSELVSAISTRRRIPKDSVVMELNKKAQDPDVVATSQVLSLKCPLSYMRLDTPCRSLSCTHIQCFDATSYLQLQEQGPQWLCPICNKSAPFEQLAVDEYVKDILENTSKSLETVTIEPNGRWLIKPSDDDKGDATNGASFGEEDDEFEISEVSVVGGRRHETPNQPTPALSTPVSGGRDSASVGPRGMGSISHKRPAQPVVDLTLSSDEDDEPIQRPTKRQATSSNGVRGPGGLDFLNESLGYPP
ncbi:E3 SUMO-protein ligase pli1 [Paramyrothecium foliicola]|nr:E3 SUMO-protein ligase pli1 [Paramyrothecium foliicola]